MALPRNESASLRHISVCSGVGGMDLGFHNAGSTAVALCEFDPWRRELLAHHWPGVPIFPDLSELDPEDLPDADLLIGGTPCQDLSVNGLRAGLDGERSGLFWDYIRIRNARDIEWAVWENVEGALSSGGGLDFACVLGAFVGADVAVPAGGWSRAGVVAGPWGGAVWRVLDAQHFGVPQRRRRVFVVGHLGGPCPPEVLLEPQSRSGDHQEGCGARQGTASPLEDGTGIARTLTTSNQRLDVDTESFIVGTLPARGRTGGFDVDPQIEADGSVGFDASEDGAGRGTPLVPDRVRAADGVAGSLDGSASAWDPQPDGRRYAACGDGVVEPVARWIAQRVIARAAREELAA